ncbi:IclR family transcriptional regulator [bacterium LRH843]|nr:IclR family transcriptional regulator [bacterium LRH843]
MGQKYWVPAIERANLILTTIAKQPAELRLIDLSKSLDINKSSMYSLLNTMETLGWVVKKKGDKYSLGPSVGSFSAAYFKQFNLLQSFYSEASKPSCKIAETIQLGILEGHNVFYLAKEESHSRVRIATDPGMHFPAHASAIGKIQLSQHTYRELEELYPMGKLEARTPNTITDLKRLWRQLEDAREKGYITESEEGNFDLHCVAAPVFNFENKLIAGVSFSMLTTSWQKKKDEATSEIIKLAKRLSLIAGNS